METKKMKVSVEMTVEEWSQLLTDVSLRNSAEERADRMWRENEELKARLEKFQEVQVQ